MSNHGFPDDLTILSQPETWAPLKICIMATTNNNKSVVKNVADNAWAGLCWCGNALVSLGQWIIVAIVLALLLVIVFNPVMFLFWSIVSPRRAARMLYAEDDFGLYSEFVRDLNGWMVALYPFRMKKHFMAVRGINNYSAKAQCRYYRKTGRRISVLGQMTNEAVQQLWEGEFSFEEKVKIASSGMKLSDEQFAFLVDRHQTEEALAYIRKWTPNANKLRYLIEYDETEVLIPAIRIYGLPAELISLVFAEGKSELIADVQEALVVYSHRQTVLNTQRSDENGRKEWLTFCNSVEKDKIRSNAQKAMNGWQYDEFHKAGHALDASAVEFFFAKGDVAMCIRIFKYEKDNGRVSEKADALVAANPKLTAALLQVLSEQKAA